MVIWYERYDSQIQYVASFNVPSFLEQNDGPLGTIHTSNCLPSPVRPVVFSAAWDPATEKVHSNDVFCNLSMTCL